MRCRTRWEHKWVVGFFLVVWATGSVASSEEIVLSRAWLIDGTGAPVQEDAWIHVVDGRIEAVGTGSPPSTPGARALDLQGKTVIPGLADMHVHLGGPKRARWILKLLLAHGITTAKDTGNTLGNQAAIRRWMQGKAVPHVTMANRPIQGSYWNKRFLNEGSEVEELMENYLTFGVDFIKVYNWLSSQGLRQVVSIARRHDVPVIGHTPLSMTSVAAIDAGLQILEHVRLRPWEVLDDPELVARYPIDEAYVRRTNFWAHYQGDEAIGQRTLEAWEKRKDRFYIVPTLSEHEATVGGYDPGVTENPDLSLVSPATRQRWKEQPRDQWGDLSPEEIVEAKASVAGMTRFIGQAHDRGVRVLAGSDIGMAWVVPGVSLHRELELFAEAGLSTETIIESSTGLAAAALRVSERGTIAAGQEADLVIVGGDLARDIGVIERIDRVMLAGRLHEPGALLEEAAELAAQDVPDEADAMSGGPRSRD